MFAAQSVIQGALTDTAALAAVALIGYLFGRRTRNATQNLSPELLRELDRAQSIAVEMRSLAKRIRRDVAMHHGSVQRFQSDTTSLLRNGADEGWQELSHYAEQLLGPSKKLASDMSIAYEQLRRYTNELLTFTNSRTDPESGVHTRRALEEHLDLLFSVPMKPQGRLSLALFSVAAGDAKTLDPGQINEFIRLTGECAREADFVARYSADEVAVVMPQTTLAGATILGDRLRRSADERLGFTVWGGVVEKAGSDSLHSLLSRADTALYSARTHSEPCLFQHTGETTRRCYAISQATAGIQADQPVRDKTPHNEPGQSTTSAPELAPADFLEV